MGRPSLKTQTKEHFRTEIESKNWFYVLHRNTVICLHAECTNNTPKKQRAAKSRLHSGHVCKCKAFRL